MSDLRERLEEKITIALELESDQELSLMRQVMDLAARETLDAALARLRDLPEWATKEHAIGIIELLRLSLSAPANANEEDQGSCPSDQSQPLAHVERFATDAPVAEVDLLQTMDALVWAREFCRITGFQDEAWALSWFANAIMTGWDHREWQTPEYQARVAAVLAEPPTPEG